MDIKRVVICLSEDTGPHRTRVQLQRFGEVYARHRKVISESLSVLREVEGMQIGLTHPRGPQDFSWFSLLESFEHEFQRGPSNEELHAMRDLLALDIALEFCRRYSRADVAASDAKPAPIALIG